MLRLEKNKYFSQKYIYSIWFLMSFQAGYVNVGGLSTAGHFVSHVTGTSSRIALGLSTLDLNILLNFVTILLSFIFGAAFSSYNISRRIELNRPPKYTLVLFVKSIFFGFVLLASIYGKGQFNILLIFFLSFCCGIQNATCAQSTQGFLKPTHMTGMSTDIGIVISKLLALKSTNKKLHKEEYHKNLLRICILGFFILGGTFASIIFNKIGTFGFFFPFVSSICFLAMSWLRDFQKEELKVTSPILNAAKGSILLTFMVTVFTGFNFILN